MGNETKIKKEIKFLFENIQLVLNYHPALPQNIEKSLYLYRNLC